MASVTIAAFGTLDGLVLGGYLVLIVGAGLWFSRRRQEDTGDYFLAGRRIPSWVAAMSLMATALSGATFIGVPAQAYGGNLTYLWSYVGQIIAAVIVATLFIPAFYRHNVSTVYQLLDVRCGPAARRSASAMFMVGRVLASGARLYIAALAAAMVLFGSTALGPVCAAIALIAVIGIAYTIFGGIAAVVWTDVIQSCVFVAAVVIAIAVLLRLIPADSSQIMAALSEPLDERGSKLTAFRSGFEGVGAKYSFTLLTALFGHSLIGLGAFGTDQDLTQRLLTCRTARQAGRAAVSGVLMTVPVAFAFLIVGLLLWVFYQRPDLMGSAAPVSPEQAKDVFITFILHELPAGLGGLLIAGLLAAALSSTNSELNAMSSTLICDFYRPLRPGRPERHYLAAGRWGVALWGAALGGFAMLAAYWHARSQDTLIEFALGMMTFAYSGLVGVFLTVLLTRRGNTVSVIAAFAAGFLTVLVLQLLVASKRLDLAFPWQMTLATTLAFVVCWSGAPRQRGALVTR